MSGYEFEEFTDADLEADQALYRPFTDAIRGLVDAGVRSTVSPEEIRAAQAEIEAITARLRASQREGSYGVAFNGSGKARPYGNSVVGLRNAVAPPVPITWGPDGLVTADFTLGAAYEGPPGLVHGGVSALILDQMLGEAAAASGRPGMTGTLTLRYERGTPLGRLHAEAKATHRAGVKSFVSGWIGDADGPTVRAEGVFILPRWARKEQSRFE